MCVCVNNVVRVKSELEIVENEDLLKTLSKVERKEIRKREAAGTSCQQFSLLKDLVCALQVRQCCARYGAFSL